MVTGDISSSLPTPPLDAGDSPLQHDTYGNSNVNLLAAASGSGSLQASTINTGSSATLKAAHAWLCTIGWGVLIPAGMVAARFKIVRPPGWFHAHRAFQVRPCCSASGLAACVPLRGRLWCSGFDAAA